MFAASKRQGAMTSSPIKPKDKGKEKKRGKNKDKGKGKIKDKGK